jgi:hypothetical protein
MKVGDIVTMKGQRGLWVIRGQDEGSLPKKRWHAMQQCGELFTNHDAGSGDVTTVASPAIAVGDWLKYRGRDARVLAVSPDAIRVTYDERHEVSGGGFVRFQNCEADVPRHQLVLENLIDFLKQEAA